MDYRLRWGFGLSIAALLWVGVILSGSTQPADNMMIVMLRDWGNATPSWLTQAFLIATRIGDYPMRVAATLVAAVLLLLRGERRSAVVLLTAIVLLSGTIDNVLKPVFARPRPELVPWLTPATGYSLPSGHALGGAMTFLLIALLFAPLMHSRMTRGCLWTAALLLVLLIGVSRPWLGVHWPSDVVAGWMIGGAAAMLLAVLARPRALAPSATAHFLQ